MCQPNKLRQFATRGKLKAPGKMHMLPLASCNTHAHTHTYLPSCVLIQFIYIHVLNPFADSFIIHHIKCFITRCASSPALSLSLWFSRSLRPDSNPITVIKSHPYENCIITAHTHTHSLWTRSSYAQVYKHIKYNLLNVNPERNF